MPCYSPATRSSFVRLPDEFYVTNFTDRKSTLPFLLMVHASTLSAILYSADASGDLMSASSISSAHESWDFDSPASDAWLVAHLLILQLLWVHLLVLTIRLVLWCSLLSFKGGKTLAINQREISARKNSINLLSKALLSLLHVDSRKHHSTHCFRFTFEFKYSLRKALVQAHAF